VQNGKEYPVYIVFYEEKNGEHHYYHESFVNHHRVFYMIVTSEIVEYKQKRVKTKNLNIVECFDHDQILGHGEIQIYDIPPLVIVKNKDEEILYSATYNANAPIVVSYCTTNRKRGKSMTDNPKFEFAKCNMDLLSLRSFMKEALTYMEREDCNIYVIGGNI
jgi:hypothetical protein